MMKLNMVTRSHLSLYNALVAAHSSEVPPRLNDKT